MLPWALRTYYYGDAAHKANDTYDGAWYGSQRREGARLVRTYLSLQPHVEAKLANLSLALLGRTSQKVAEPDGSGIERTVSRPRRSNVQR